MDKKITISELSQLLSTNVSLINKKGWEDFLRLFFAQISEGLQAEGNVKIKGLGTFKVVTVDARKSKDVNTGANTIIPAHNKITFTPDSALAETLNKPYAHFEATYVLAPDGDVDAPEVEEEDEESADIQAEVSSGTETESIKIEDEPKIEPVKIEDEPKAEPAKIEDEPKIEPIRIEDKPKAEPAKIEDEPVELQTAASSGTEPKTESEKIEDVPGEEPEESEETDPNADEDENIDTTPAETKQYASTVKRHDLPDDDDDDDEKNSQSKKLCITAIIILGLLIVIGLIVNMLYPKIFSEIRAKITGSEPAKTEIKVDPVDLAEQQAIEDEVIANMAENNAEATNALVDSIEKKEAEATVNGEDVKPATKQNVKGTTKFKDDFINYMKVKHPEMDITDKGDPIEEKLGQASRLTLVSLRHYGAKDFWIYIYLYNKDVIKNPNNIKAGTKIKVPDLDRKKFVNPESEHSILTAKEVQHKFVK